jgi:hypothetical protein
MDNSIHLHEDIGVEEYIKAEIGIDAIIYRQEFERHRSEYQRLKAEDDNSKTEAELIFAFIFLQIYIECFLHQNMRRIIKAEFEHSNKVLYEAWLAGEKRYVPAKLDVFVNIFFNPNPPHIIISLVNIIKDNFGKISHIRNLFAHGHKISSWSDSEGNHGATSAKLLLSESQLNQSLKDMNELGVAWNDLLEGVRPQCKAINKESKFINDLKFQIF